MRKRAVVPGILALSLVSTLPLAAQEDPGADRDRTTRPADDATLADPSGTRLFIAPTARTLPALTGKAGTYNVVLPYGRYAAAEEFEFGAGTPLLPDHFLRAWYGGVKVRAFSGGMLDAAVGGFAYVALPRGRVKPEVDPLIGWAAATFGGVAHAVTLGVAHGFFPDGNVADDAADGGADGGTTDGDADTRPVVFGGAELLLARNAVIHFGHLPAEFNIKLVAEAYGSGATPDGDAATVGDCWFSATCPGETTGGGLLLVGPRVHGERFSFELAGALLLHDGGVRFLSVPLANFSVRVW